MFFQSGIDGGNDFGRQAVFPDKNKWFESMGKTSEVFVLMAIERAEERPTEETDFFTAQLAGPVCAIKISPENYVLSAIAEKGPYLR